MEKCLHLQKIELMYATWWFDNDCYYGVMVHYKFTVDIERIDNLPLLEYYDMLGDLSESQIEEYSAKLPINESKLPLQSTKVDFTIAEGIENGILVDAEDFINKLRKNVK